MSKKITFLIILMMVTASTFFFTKKEEREISKLREQHSFFLKSHPYNKLINLTKQERKNLGIPPNKYFEEQYLLEMNPRTGRAEFEKKFALQEELLDNNGFQKNVPGSDNNAWIERGPSNVPGRTRAILFDPNDPTGKRVFAGGVSGGLWVIDDITNANASWTQIDVPENLAVSSITVDPNDSNIMYLGTGESYVQGQVNGNGIWKSTNGGTSWSHIFGGSTGVSFFNAGSEVTINSPANLSGDLVAIRGAFGPAFNTAITGNVVLVDDGSALPTEGCSALTNASAVNGNVAIVRRGSCNFTLKVKNAQDAGASAVIVVNNVPGNPFVMAGTDNTINIPSVMISKSDGDAIISELQSQTVNTTLNDTNPGTPIGLPVVPGIFLVNDIIARNNNGTTEIYASVGDAIYREGPGNSLGGTDFGLYRSTNAGVTWSRVNLPLTPNNNPYEPNDIEIGPDNTIWLSTTSSSGFGDGGGTIFSSIDGLNFTQRHVVANARRTEIEVSTTNSNKVYVLADENPVTLLRTTNGFNSTEILQLPDDADLGIPANDFTRGQAFYDLMVEVDPTNDEIVYVGGIDIFRSTTGGTGTSPDDAWTQISKWSNNLGLNTLNVPLVHADIHGLVFSPTNTNQAIISTDGGVYYANSLSAANNSPSAISGRGNDYNTGQYYWGAINQSISQDQLLGGTQDNGSNFILNAGVNTTSAFEISGGDGGYCFIDKDNEYLITSFTNNNYTRFDLPFSITDGGTPIVRDGSSGSFINPAELDDNLDILYTNGTAGSLQISRFTDLLTTTPVRTNFTDPLLTGLPTALKVSPFTTASTTLFVGTSGGNLLKITGANNSPSWSDITGPEFLGSISAINFGANENEIMVTFHNYGVNSIWFTEDGGSTWQNKEGDFPDIPVKAILMNPLLNNEVIIGTDLGVWRTDNFKSTNPNWAQSQNGMQNVKVTSFDLRTSDNTVLASTYGRGFFTGQFTAQPLSVEEISENDDRIQLYPIPSNGALKINTSLDFGASKLSIFDFNGRMIYSESKNIFGVTELNLTSLPKGAYILNIESEQYSFNKKILLN